MNATPRFLQLADVAEILNISGAQVYALVRRGELRAIKIGGRGQWRVEASELEAYIERAYAEADKFVDDAPVRRRAGRDQGLSATTHPGTPLDRGDRSHGDHLDAGVPPLSHVQLEEVATDPCRPDLRPVAVDEVHQTVLLSPESRRSTVRSVSRSITDQVCSLWRGETAR